MTDRLDAALGLLREELEQCRRCEHPVGVQPIVSLARAPRIMLVGQAPGKTEAAGGPAFAGRAGRTLFRWFASVGIDEATIRARVYIAAVTRCYPGPSPDGRGDRVPTPEERRRCSSWLTREIELIRPAVVIPVGRLAIDTFLGSPRSLSGVIGREHRVAVGGRETVVVPLPHPSGASSWIHQAGHAALLERALALIAAHWKRVHPRTESITARGRAGPPGRRTRVA